MRPLSRRHALFTMFALAPAAGCYGSFNLTKKVYGWNGSFSSSIVKELVFLGLLIIPVYAVAMLIDAIILNLIEFFSGSNPVSARDLGDGHRVAFERLPDGDTVRVTHQEQGKPDRVFLVRRHQGGFELLNADAGSVATVKVGPQGGALLHDSRGQAMLEVPVEELERMEREVEHQPLSLLVTDVLREPSNRRLAWRPSGVRF